MPTTAKYIVDNNKNGAINFKGFLVGNPFTNTIENSIGSLGTYYGHQLLPQPLWLQWEQKCLGQVVDPETCEVLELELMEKTGDVYPYGIDWPVCLSDNKFTENQWFLEKVVHETLGRPIPNWYKKDYKSKKKNERKLLQFDECAVDYMTTYLNRADVQKALHARPNTKWNLCGGCVYNYADSLIPMEPKYEYLCEGGYNLKMAIYSGDDDTVCGTMGTQYWMWNMTNWNTTSDGSWRAWDDVNGQTGGYRNKWNCGKNQNISLVTVHSAGHQVPWFKQQRALWVFENFLKGSFS